MLTAPIQTEVSYALANLVTVDWEHLVLVSKDPDPVLVIKYLISMSNLNSNISKYPYGFVYRQISTSVLLPPITVILTPHARTQTEASHVHATQASVVPEHPVQVKIDCVILLSI